MGKPKAEGLAFSCAGAALVDSNVSPVLIVGGVETHAGLGIIRASGDVLAHRLLFVLASQSHQPNPPPPPPTVN